MARVVRTLVVLCCGSSEHDERLTSNADTTTWQLFEVRRPRPRRSYFRPWKQKNSKKNFTKSPKLQSRQKAKDFCIYTNISLQLTHPLPMSIPYVHTSWTLNGFETNCHFTHGGFDMLHIRSFVTKSYSPLPHSFFCRGSKI